MPCGENFAWDHDNPLRRMKGETRNSNQALRDYVLMGSARSLRKLYKRYTDVAQTGGEPPTQYWSTIAGWSAKYNWPQRAERWQDLENERIEQEWVDRRKAWLQKEWDLGQALLEKAEEMLGHPLTRVVEEGEDGTKVIIEPADWAVRDIKGMAEAASKLSRLAAQLETDRQRIDLPQINHIEAVPPDSNAPDPDAPNEDSDA